MTPEGMRVVHYDERNFRSLMAELKTLSTFAEVAAWDQRAQAEVDRIASVMRGLDTEMAAQLQALEQAKQARSEKPLLSRVFGGHGTEKDIAQHIEQYRDYKATLEGLVSQLQEAIGFTPNSPEEQKVLLEELRRRKKELRIEKREVSAATKAIRMEARQKSARAARVAASERRSIRHAKEAALRPHEDAKAAIERQIAQIERDIPWIERLKE